MDVMICIRMGGRSCHGSDDFLGRYDAMWGGGMFFVLFLRMQSENNEF